MRIFLLLLLYPFLFINAQIKFDADFESGNLKTVTPNGSNEFTVTAHSDIGARWFYFRITGVKNNIIKVNFNSTDVTRPVYSYDNIIFSRFSASEAPRDNYFEKYFYEDTVYVAYYEPYSYSLLQERLYQWNTSPYIKLDTLGTTPRGLFIQEMILTDFSVPDSSKEHIWIHARTHPGETPTSFHFDGIVNTLLKDNPVIQYYREKLVFHLIPFTNPEGVFYGRSRTNYDGIDLERDWNFPDSQTTAEVRILKSRLAAINSIKPVKVFLNLHSQASPYCTFWIHTASSTSQLFYRQEYQFSYLNLSNNPYFVPADLRESNLQSYFAEGWLWNNHAEDVMALTYETPYDYYSTGIWVDTQNLNKLGEQTVYALAEYLELSHPEHLLLDNKTVSLEGQWYSSQTGKEFYGKDFIYAASGAADARAVFQSESLKPGSYEVYGWWTPHTNNASNTLIELKGGSSTLLTKVNQKTDGAQWKYLTSISINSESPLRITVIKENADGTVVADAFKVIYAGLPSDVKEPYAPADFTLYQNYPNPFNPATTIKFKLTAPGQVNLTVYNSIGEKVVSLVDDYLAAGEHRTVFNSEGLSLPSGVYYYRLIQGDKSFTKGMLLLK